MSRIEEVRAFVQECDRDLQRVFDFQVDEVRDSGAGGGVYTVKGHAAVFNKWSLDLGGFRERIKKGAFDNALSKDPHVMHLWDHDTSRSLASTRSATYPLELRVDPHGLHYYSKVAPTSYAADLRILLDGGVIDQSSFAFTVAKDEWRLLEEDGEERVERTIVEVDELFDVTTCAMGAYPTTDSALALRSLANKSASKRASAVSFVTPMNVTSTTSGALWVPNQVVASERTGDEKEDAPVEDPVVTPQTEDEAVTEPPEDREAKARVHERWQMEKAARHRRIRERAYGVDNEEQK